MLTSPLRSYRPFRYPLLLLALLALLGSNFGTRLSYAADPAPVEVNQQLLHNSSDTRTDRPALVALVPGQEARIRVSFANRGTTPALVQAHWRLTLSSEQPALSDAREQHSVAPIQLRLAPGEQRQIDLPLPPSATRLDESVTLDPADATLLSVIRYCLLNQGERACPAADPSRVWENELPIPIRPHDLGDAPDSTNHFGAAMLAYPAIQAEFPTVFDPAVGVPSGPLHRNPRPFHLGRRVSLEAEADIGPDQDPLNNIVPPANNPDNDRGDDGVRLNPANLQHCQAAKVEVSVFIDPAYQANLLANGITTGYLNLWLDGNRDGDWADVTQCPNAQPAFEHIVIDQTVAIATLVGGTNLLTVTTGLLPWPDPLKDKPAWLRATLSLEPATKPFQVGGVAYGDGRGFYNAQGVPARFRSGETEDYLINRAGGQGEADIEVHKWGRIERFDPANPNDGRITWLIEYRNRGDAPAQEVVLRDRLDNGQNIIAILIGLLVSPEKNYVKDESSLRFNLGTLAPGEGGRIVITTSLPASDVTLLRNLVEVEAANDSNLENNRAAAEVNLELPAPVILFPGPGTTSRNRISIGGQSLAGTNVRVFDESGSIDANSFASQQGRWQTEVTLTPGQHLISARARLGNRESAPADPLRIIANDQLPYDPLSMRFIEQGDRSRFRPVDEQGRTDDGGWKIYLKPQTSYGLSFRATCAEPTSRFALDIDGFNVDVVENPARNGNVLIPFNTGIFTDTKSLTLRSQCGNQTHTSNGQVMPADTGIVSDALSGAPLAGARVTLREISTPGGIGAEQGQSVQVTGADGAYSFVVPPGRYVLEVRKDGYQPYRSAVIEVSGAPVALDIALAPRPQTGAGHRIAFDGSSFETQLLRVRPGALIEIVNVDLWEHAIVSPRDAASGLPTGNRLADTTSLESGMLNPGESYTLSFASPGSYVVSAGGTSRLTVLVEEAPQIPSENRRVYLPLVVR